MNAVKKQDNSAIEELIPNLPQKRRLSSTCWERSWNIQFQDALNSPHSIHELASAWSNDQVKIQFQLRTPTKICCVMRMENACDDAFIELSKTLFDYLNKSIGQIHKVEDRAISNWFSLG